MSKNDGLKQYAARLHERRGEAALLQWADVSIGDWRPTPNECHGNVTTICERDSSYTAVRGWLYFDFDDLLDQVKFVAHSAVRTPDGTLCDITPSNASQQYPFIPAEETEKIYSQLVEGSGITELWHVKDHR